MNTVEGVTLQQYPLDVMCLCVMRAYFTELKLLLLSWRLEQPPAQHYLEEFSEWGRRGAPSPTLTVVFVIPSSTCRGENV